MTIDKETARKARDLFNREYDQRVALFKLHGKRPGSKDQQRMAREAAQVVFALYGINVDDLL